LHIPPPLLLKEEGRGRKRCVPRSREGKKKGREEAGRQDNIHRGLPRFRGEGGGKRKKKKKKKKKKRKNRSDRNWSGRDNFPGRKGKGSALGFPLAALVILLRKK